MWFALLLLLSFPAYAKDQSSFEYSKFFKAKTLVKDALEKQSLEVTKYKKTKELRTGIVSTLTGSLLGIRQKLNNQIDFAVISSDANNTDELMEKGVLFITIKLRYADKKGEIFWELTSVISDQRIDFYSVVDNGLEVDENDLYVYKRLYRQ